MDTQDTTQRDLQNIANLMGIIVLFYKTYYRLREIVVYASSRESYPPLLFLQAICAGFESRMGQLVQEEQADPICFNKKHNVAPLREIQQEIGEALLAVPIHRDRLVSAFKNAFNSRVEQINRVALQQKEKDNEVIKSILTGDDILAAYSGTTGDENLGDSPWGYVAQLGVLNRKLMSFGTIAKYTNYFDGSLNLIIATTSATVSVLFVELDDLGRFIGGELALLTKRLLYPSLTKKLAEKIAPGLLMLMYAYELITYSIYEYSTLFFDHTIIYPIFSGLMVGMCELLKEKNPAAFARVQTAIGMANVELQFGDKSKTVEQLIKECFSYAKEYYEWYDQELLATTSDTDRKRVQETLVLKNFFSSGYYLECNYRLVLFFQKHNHLKACVSAIRSLPLALSYLTTNIAFTIAKLAAAPIAEHSLEVKNEVVAYLTRHGFLARYTKDDKIAEKSLLLDEPSP